MDWPIAEYSWTVDIDPFLTPAVQTNWSVFFADAGSRGGFTVESTGAVNAQIGWDITLGAGTWTFTLMHYKSNSEGIVTVALDGTSVGTIDGYNATVLQNQISTITGVVVAVSAKKRLTLTMATKNASSTSYFGDIGALALRRTS